MLDLSHITEGHKDWEILILAINEENPAKVHEDIYWYFLEVLPPMAMGKQALALIAQENNNNVIDFYKNHSPSSGTFIFKEGSDQGWIFFKNSEDYYFAGKTLFKYDELRNRCNLRKGKIS